MRAFAALGIIYYGPDSSLAQGFVHRVRFCRAHLTACARALPRSARGYGQNSAKSCRMRTISRLPAEDIYPQAPRRSVRCLRPGLRRTRPAERFKSAQLGAVVAREGQRVHGQRTMLAGSAARDHGVVDPGAPSCSKIARGALLASCYAQLLCAAVTRLKLNFTEMGCTSTYGRILARGGPVLRVAGSSVPA